MIRTIGEGGINWNWYLCADFDKDAKTCHIYFHERWHKYEHRGSYHPKAEWLGFQGYRLLEDEKRIVYGVVLEGIEYLVTNPAETFSYRDMTHYVADKA